MSLGRLQFLRFIVPAVLILVFAKILGSVTGWWTATLPDFSKSEFLPAVIGPAAIYYITPLRSWVNARHHERVTENLRKGLVEISGYPDKPEKYTWKHLRSLFYSLIDGDDSLKNKAELAYSNGVIWTSFADCTALALIFLVGTIGLYWLSLTEVVPAIATFLAIMVISIIGSFVTTRKQMSIGEEQLETIKFKYKTDVEKRLNSLD